MHILLWEAILPQSKVFCGMYITSTGSKYYSEYAQVAVVYQGNQSTLTIVNDIQSESREIDCFTLIFPIPNALTADTTNILKSEVFDRLDSYSQRRSIQYIVLEC